VLDSLRIALPGSTAGTATSPSTTGTAQPVTVTTRS
jgi:hypothetical protein